MFHPYPTLILLDVELYLLPPKKKKKKEMWQKRAARKKGEVIQCVVLGISLMRKRG